MRQNTHTHNLGKNRIVENLNDFSKSCLQPFCHHVGRKMPPVSLVFGCIESEGLCLAGLLSQLRFAVGLVPLVPDDRRSHKHMMQREITLRPPYCSFGICFRLVTYCTMEKGNLSFEDMSRSGRARSHHITQIQNGSVFCFFFAKALLF